MAIPVNPNIASTAYEAANRLKGVAAPMGPAEGPSFLELLGQGLNEAVETQKTAEKLSKEAVMGTANINDVILAVQDADVVLSTLVSIRDRMVSAYQDILRMAI